VDHVDRFVGRDGRVREQRLVFGEVAQAYDDVRAGYAPELAEAVLAYAARPERLVEVGAGTGKATAAFAGHGIPITCIEPDPDMARVLRGRFPDVEVVTCRFEDWAPPPGGVPLLYCAQAWHWVDEARRSQLAYDALAKGGVLALFAHRYAFADAALEAALNEVYTRVAPQLLDDHAPGAAVVAEDDWMYAEIRATGLFVDIEATLFDRVVPYPTQRYRALLETFSNHRMLPAEQRAQLHAGLTEVVDRHGGVVETALGTVLIMGRRR
jgi:trans-aconitate methyltransferase